MEEQKCFVAICMLCLLVIPAYAESDAVMRHAAQKRLSTTEVQWMLMTSSVGELVRQSQAIVVGEISNLRKDSKVDEKGNPSLWGDVRIDEVILGNHRSIGSGITVEIRSTDPQPTRIIRGWLFLTKKPINWWQY